MGAMGELYFPRGRPGERRDPYRVIYRLGVRSAERLIFAKRLPVVMDPGLASRPGMTAEKELPAQSRPNPIPALRD